MHRAMSCDSWTFFLSLGSAVCRNLSTSLWDKQNDA